MGRKHLFIATLLAGIFLGGCTIPFLSRQQSALQVTSNPPASVYLNGNHVGQTPYYDNKLKPGDYTVRLLVDDDPTKDWQTQVTLASKIVSVINKNFGATDNQSSDYFLQLEPLASKTAIELSIVTIPDNVIVKVDNQPQGFSPVSIKDVTEGDHTITLSAPGYQELSITAQTKPGYKLITSAHLGELPNLPPNPEASGSAQIAPATSSATPQPTPKPTVKATPSPTPKKSTTVATSSGELSRPYVTIKETGTGWLRVRSTPSGTTSNEVAKVNVGDSFPYLDSQNGWYQIEFEPGKDGWISAQYATLYK